jgi:hypothetical protein
MKISRELATALVRRWHANGFVIDAVREGKLCEGELIGTTEAWVIVGQLGATTHHGRRPLLVRRWMGLHHRIAGDLLWAGKPDEAAIKALMTIRPDTRQSSPLFGDHGARAEERERKRIRCLNMRNLSYGTNWKMVK